MSPESVLRAKKWIRFQLSASFALKCRIENDQCDKFELVYFELTKLANANAIQNCRRTWECFLICIFMYIHESEMKSRTGGQDQVSVSTGDRFLATDLRRKRCNSNDFSAKCLKEPSH